MSGSLKRTHDSFEDGCSDEGLGDNKTIRSSGLVYNSQISETDKLKFALQNGCQSVCISFRASTGEGSIPSLRHGLVKSTFDNILQPDDSVRISRRGRIILTTKHHSTIDNLQSIELIGETPVVWSAVAEAITTKFVIRDIDIDYSLIDIAEGLQNSGVNFTQVVRFCRKGSDAPIPIVLVKELGHQSRSEVIIDRVLHRISPYYEIPKICYKCLSFGHFQSSCVKKDRCKTCGDSHTLTTPCVKEPICFRCGNSGHSALDYSCEVYKKEKLIVNRAKSDHISYREASKILSSPTSFANVVKNSPKCDESYNLEFPQLKADTAELKKIVKDLSVSVASFISSERIEKIESRLDVIESRIKNVESDISHLVTDNGIITEFLYKCNKWFPVNSLTVTPFASKNEKYVYNADDTHARNTDGTFTREPVNANSETVKAVNPNPVSLAAGIFTYQGNASHEVIKLNCPPESAKIVNPIVPSPDSQDMDI